MVTRQLTDDEKKLTKANLIKLKEELEYARYYEKHSKLMIEEGLMMNYRKALEEKKQLLKKIEGDIEVITQTIDVCDKQLKEGVEVKNNG